MAKDDRFVEIENPDTGEAFAVHPDNFDKDGLHRSGKSYKAAGFKIVRYEGGEEYNPRKADKGDS